MIQEIKPWLCWRFLPVKVLAGTTVISKVFWERICFQVHSHGCWLASCPYWLFIETSTPCHIGLSTWQFSKCSWLSLEWVIEQKKEYLRWKTVSLLSNFGSKFTSLWPFSIHLKGQPTPKRREFNTDTIIRRQKIIGEHLETSYHILWINLTCKKAHGL